MFALVQVSNMHIMKWVEVLYFWIEIVVLDLQEVRKTAIVMVMHAAKVSIYGVGYLPNI